MSQRISLTRLVALNWYGFRQIFEVEDNVLISGAFGTGKSALLDLMQYVLLGAHWRANRAAAGNARGRDLVGYCLGDTNQTRDGQRHFLRSSGVTLVALEFTRAPEDPRQPPQRETWGIRLQFTSPTAAPGQTYFYVPKRLEYADIAPEGRMLPDDAFRAWLRREYGNECLFQRQQDYLEEMAAPRHLNFDAAAFQRTFPKAIAFELEDSVEKFIREFILEESPLDVREVRAALRAYDDTRRRLEKQEDEAAFLRRICAQHERCDTSRREEAVLRHLQHALKLRQAEERRERHAADLQRLETEHADDLMNLTAAKAEALAVGRLLEAVRFEIQQDPDGGKLLQLDRQKRDLHLRVSSLRETRRAILERLEAHHRAWLQWLKHGASLPLEGLKAALKMDDTLLAPLRAGTDAARLEALPKLASHYNALTLSVHHLLRPLEDSLKAAGHRLGQLAEDLEHLAKGQAPGSFPLFNAARSKLGDRVEQLGRLIEVRPEAERWWPALELFLGRNRWAIVVHDAADYKKALEILRRTAPGREGESLLHPSEAGQLRGGSRDGSLFGKVDVTHPVARSFVEHLLGDVICVENVAELETTSAGRAITPEGIFKQAPLRRRLKPAASVELTLGREGLERMRSAKQKEQNETRSEYEALERRRSDVQSWLESGRRSGLAESAVHDRASELSRLPELETELGQLRETIDLLTTPEREARQEQLSRLEEQKTGLDRKVGSLLQLGEQFTLRSRPHLEALDSAAEDIANVRLLVEESRLDLGRRFRDLSDSELTQRRDQLREAFPKWSDCFDELQRLAKKAGEAAIEARAQRNGERERLSTARDERGNLRHPEYQTEFPPDDDDNAPWAARLGVLESVELEKSRLLAADRKTEWERRLEDNVLNALNRRLADATDTIRLLDRYLSQPVGRFRYRISQRRDTAAYGAIWTLLDTGLEPTDELLAAIPDVEIQRAKEELMRAVDAPENGDERARRLLDYRTYHHYDLEMVPADRPDAPPISLGRSGRNLSGGESQAPFFISMLAAFRRVYDRGDRSSNRSQQLGLVVMDEAFSKLSGDGIEDCLALARAFQLQLVMAFPPERLGVMVPHAQTVVICQKEVERDKEGYVTHIANIPLLTTMAEALDALE